MAGLPAALFLHALQGAPDPLPDVASDPKLFVGMMLLGFVIGIFGHINKSKTFIALGIGLIFLATFLLPFVIYNSKS